MQELETCSMQLIHLLSDGCLVVAGVALEVGVLLVC